MGTPYAISETSICNEALSNAGAAQAISSFSDGSNEAAQCAIWYPSIRDKMLAEFTWPWAQAYWTLTEVAGIETTGQRANAEWQRSYRYPQDCITLRRVVRTPPPLVPTGVPQTTGTFGTFYWNNEPWRRAVGEAHPVSYGESHDAGGRLIISDFFGPYGLTATGTAAVSDPSQFRPDWVGALSWRLGGHLAMALGVGEKRRDYCFKRGEELDRSARATAMNELQTDIPFVQHQSLCIRRRWSSC